LLGGCKVAPRAQHAKEVAKAELLKLEHQLMEEKKQREKELADRRALVQQKVATLAALPGRVGRFWPRWPLDHSGL
jgi:hypothetical protein